MSDGTYQPPEGYLTLAQAQARLGVSKPTILRMTRDGRLETYEDRRDRRVRLVKVEDVEALAQPIKGAA
jgi:excisionase family DNA binding protein